MLISELRALPGSDVYAQSLLADMQGVLLFKAQGVPNLSDAQGKPRVTWGRG